MTTSSATRLALLAFALLAPAAGRAAAQAAVVGTYTYSWTDTSGTPITAASIPVGTTITVQVRITEGGGGNLFSAGGITSYDNRTTWTNSNVSIAKSGTGNTANTFIRTNPYPTGTGFNGPGGTVTNTATDGFNSNHLMNLSRAVQSTLDPSTFVKSSIAPNAGNTILLIEFLIRGDVEGTTMMTAQQNPSVTNNAYFDTASGQFFNYDSAIGSASADLSLTVTPVPEPATAFAVTALGLVVGAARRRRPWRCHLSSPSPPRATAPAVGNSRSSEPTAGVEDDAEVGTSSRARTALGSAGRTASWARRVREFGVTDTGHPLTEAAGGC